MKQASLRQKAALSLLRNASKRIWGVTLRRIHEERNYDLRQAAAEKRSLELAARSLKSMIEADDERRRFLIRFHGLSIPELRDLVNCYYRRWKHAIALGPDYVEAKSERLSAFRRENAIRIEHWEHGKQYDSQKRHK